MRLLMGWMDGMKAPSPRPSFTSALAMFVLLVVSQIRPPQYAKRRGSTYPVPSFLSRSHLPNQSTPVHFSDTKCDPCVIGDIRMSREKRNGLTDMQRSANRPHLPIPFPRDTNTDIRHTRTRRTTTPTFLLSFSLTAHVTHHHHETNSEREG